KEGKVIMQTYNPSHYVCRFARTYDYFGFYDKESNVRQTTHFPPYSVIARVLISSEDEAKAQQAARQGYELLRKLKEQTGGIFRVQAMRAPIKRMMNKYRFQIVVWIDLKSENEALPLVYKEMKNLPSKGVSSFIEINPMQMM
ncbi:MAG: hypothetical protein PHC84_05880, partial [Clostridia bacterium]|nr:hypothetical protein [Clostridia bacterium]